MTDALPAWLHLHRGNAPLLIAMPHTGTDLAGTDPAGLDAHFASPWLAIRDADWHIDALYAFARTLGATTLHTRISRSVIDVNRDPSGASLYPGQATTELCPTISFDGDPLYASAAQAPDAAEIARRRALYHAPYHAALSAEIARLRAIHPHVVLYDAHAIRSRIPRLFDGALPILNIGTNGTTSCAPALEAAIATICAASPFSHVVNGRFRGGWTTRHHGAPAQGIHAIQMEIAMRGYLDEPETPSPANWPPAFDPARAAPLQSTLQTILQTALATANAFAETQP